MSTTKKTPTTKGVYHALSEFQAQCPAFPHTTKGYGYTYTDLATIVETIKPILKKCGLVHSQPLREDGLVTKLVHIGSGESIEEFVRFPQDVNLKGMNKFQVNGSAVTYYRRYALTAMLGIVSDSDADAHGQEMASKPTMTNDLLNRFIDVYGQEVNGKVVNLKSIKERYTLTATQLQTFKELEKNG